MFRAVATVGAFTMASRVLGLVRDLLIAAILGAGPVADAFFVALRLPNLFRRLFAEGAFNAAFVPVFAGILVAGGPSAARAFAERVLALMTLTLVAITLAAEVAMPWLMQGLAPGFADEPAKFALAVEMARITFPYLLLIALANLMGGMLNALDKFAAAAAAPVLLNVVMIAALAFAADWWRTPGHVLSVAVVLAGVAQLALMAWAIRRAGYRLRLVRPSLDPTVKRVLRLLGPSSIGAGVIQINLLANTLIASLLPTGAIAYLYYADRIYQLPLGMIGIAMGTALLPRLSHLFKEGNPAEARTVLNRGLELALFLTLPATVALAVIPEAVVNVLFRRGAFGAEDALATAGVLAAYAAGLPAFVLVKVLSPAFFARENTATPVKVAAIAVFANLALGIALYRPFGAVGLAFATSFAAWLNAAALAKILHARGDFAPDAALLLRVPKALLASLAMGSALLTGTHVLADWLAGAELTRATALLMVCGGNMALYFALAWVLGAADRDAVRALVNRSLDRLRRRRNNA